LIICESRADRTQLLIESQTRAREEGATPAMWLAGFVLGAIGLAAYVWWAFSGNLVREGNWIGVDFNVY
jgi:hypothetical protein